MHRRIAAAVLALFLAAPVAAQTRRPPAKKPAALLPLQKEAPEVICPTPLGTGVTTKL